MCVTSLQEVTRLAEGVEFADATFVVGVRSVAPHGAVGAMQSLYGRSRRRTIASRGKL